MGLFHINNFFHHHHSNTLAVKFNFGLCVSVCTFCEESFISVILYTFSNYLFKVVKHVFNKTILMQKLIQ